MTWAKSTPAQGILLFVLGTGILLAEDKVQDKVVYSELQPTGVYATVVESHYEEEAYNIPRRPFGGGQKKATLLVVRYSLYLAAKPGIGGSKGVEPVWVLTSKRVKGEPPDIPGLSPTQVFDVSMGKAVGHILYGSGSALRLESLKVNQPGPAKPNRENKVLIDSSLDDRVVTAGKIVVLGGRDYCVVEMRNGGVELWRRETKWTRETGSFKRLTARAVSKVEDR